MPIQSRREMPEWTPQQIRYLRNYCGLDSLRFSERVGCSHKSALLWEKGERSMHPSGRLLMTYFAIEVGFPLEEIL